MFGTGGGGGIGDMMALSSLLQDARGAAGHDDDDEQAAVVKYSPADMVNEAPRIQGPKVSKEPVKVSKAIWADDEVLREEDIEDPNDDRKRARYEIYYKQDVNTGDMFLGTNDLSPSSEDCNQMVVKVHFPGCKFADLELDVTETRFRAESSEMKLSMWMPLPVFHEDGSAKWDAKKELLIVTLPIKRE